jgi:hypothetical protein
LICMMLLKILKELELQTTLTSKRLIFQVHLRFHYLKRTLLALKKEIASETGCFQWVWKITLTSLFLRDTVNLVTLKSMKLLLFVELAEQHGSLALWLGTHWSGHRQFSARCVTKVRSEITGTTTSKLQCIVLGASQCRLLTERK